MKLWKWQRKDEMKKNVEGSMEIEFCFIAAI